MVTNISGNTVTISPGLFLPNWRADRSPGAWYSNSKAITGAGIESLSIDMTSVTTNTSPAIAWFHAYHSWVKGVRTLNPSGDHLLSYYSGYNTFRDSYMFEQQQHEAQSYDYGCYGSDGDLIENNIFQRATVPMMNEGCHGMVYGYNFNIESRYATDVGDILHAVYTHAVGTNYILAEGNDVDGAVQENFHGPAQFMTYYRNRMIGTETNRTGRLAPVIIQSFSRYSNVIGNILGDATWHNNYQNRNIDSQNTSVCEHSIYQLGWGGNCGNWSIPGDCMGYVACPIPDSVVATTLFRWGNYDVVNASNQFVSGEVPSSLTLFANAVPANNNLPNSLYLSSKPSFFGSTAWPPIGPDVTGGNVSGLGGHVYKNPARQCAEAIGVAFGNTSASTFNDSTCYPRP